MRRGANFDERGVVGDVMFGLPSQMSVQDMNMRYVAAIALR